MKQEILGLLRKTLINSSTVNAYVEMRVYQQSLASKLIDKEKDDTDYPCITLDIDSINNQGNMPKTNTSQVTISCFSKTGFTEANKIWKAVHPLLHSQSIIDDNYTIATGSLPRYADNLVDTSFEPTLYSASERLGIATFEK